MKKKRQALILELIKQYAVGTQEELLELLKEHGYDVTQATVSRDIKELRLVKLTDSHGTYRYCVNETDKSEAIFKFRTIISQSVISVDCAGNICVVKCDTGMAQAACAAIDALKWDIVVGSLAGDDTIFVLCRTPQDTVEIKKNINDMLTGR